MNGLADGLAMIPKTLTIKDKADKLDFIKISNSVPQGTIKTRRQHTVGESISKPYWIRELYLDYIKDSYYSTTKNPFF